jgi:hypothetical protein
LNDKRFIELARAVKSLILDINKFYNISRLRIAHVIFNVFNALRIYGFQGLANKAFIFSLSSFETLYNCNNSDISRSRKELVDFF